MCNYKITSQYDNLHQKASEKGLCMSMLFPPPLFPSVLQNRNKGSIMIQFDTSFGMVKHGKRSTINQENYYK